MRLIAIVTAMALLARSRSATAQGDEIAPNANLEVFGIPKAPASLAPKVRRYSNNYGLPLAGWDPAKRAAQGPERQLLYRHKVASIAL